MPTLGVDFVFSEEQEELRRVVRGFFADTSPLTETRRVMETPLGYDPGVWQLMAGQLGLQGLHVPERYGGAGLGQRELVLVFEEAGAALLCAPLLSTVGLAANALLASGDDQACADLLPGVVAGQTVATLAVCEEAGRWDEAAMTVTAAPAGAGWVLDGTKSYVTDGAVADLVLVAARTPAGVGLFAVAGDAPGLRRSPLSVMDLTRPLARVELAGVPARLIGTDGAGWAAVERALALAALALAAEQVGLAQRCLDMVVAYVKHRHQFGRPVGSFQAVKHACADTLVALEQARSAAYYAGWVADEPGPEPEGDELAVAVALARVSASAAARRAAADAVHFHGALGFTWEHDAHLFFKRARGSALLLGDPAYHRGLLAARLGLC